MILLGACVASQVVRLAVSWRLSRQVTVALLVAFVAAIVVEGIFEQRLAAHLLLVAVVFVLAAFGSFRRGR